MRTVPNDPRLCGAVVFEEGTSIVAKIIIQQMKKYAEKIGVDPLPYSHMETLVWSFSDSCLYTIGARKKGAEKSKASEYYGKHNIEIWMPSTPLQIWQNNILWTYWNKIDKSKYQYGKLLDWMIFIEYGWKIGNQGDKKNVCYELAARFSDHINLWDTRKDKDYATLYDWVANPKYKLYTP